MVHRLALALAMSLVLLVVTSGTASAGPYSYLLPPPDKCGGSLQTDTTQSAATQEAVMMCLHNYARRKVGRARLTASSKLATSSGRKAIDLRDCSASLRNSNAHECGPGDAFFRIREAGYSYSFAGENMFWGSATSDRYTPSPRRAMDWWLNSSGHRGNVLSSNFTQAGFGLAKGKLTGVSAPYGRSWVAHFGRPR